MGAHSMMQDPPPPPPGFRITGQDPAPIPPPPPGFRVVGQAAPRQDPARPQAPRQQAAPAPARPAQAATVGDTGLTRDEIFEAQRAQGYTDEQIVANMAELGIQLEPPAPTQTPPGSDYGNGFITIDGEEKPILSAADEFVGASPDELRAAGFRQADNGQWYREVAPPEPTAPTGYDTALEQERAALAERGEMGLRRYDEPGIMDQATAPFNDEVGWLIGYLTQGAGNLFRRATGRDIEVGALDRARAIRSLTQEGQDRYEQENPGLALLGAAIGGAAMGPARAGAGLLPNLGNSLGGRLAQAGGAGALMGAGEGDGTGGRLLSAATGAAIGAGTAGALEGGGSLIGRAATGIRRRAAGIPADNTPDMRVGSTIRNALARDDIAPDAYLQALDDLPAGHMPFEAGGENLIGLAEVGAQAPGRTRATLMRELQTRSDEATNRVADQVGEAFGARGNVFQELRARGIARRQAADEGMQQFGSREVALDDNALQALRQSLSSRAVREEAVNAAADLSPDGSAAANRLFALADEALDNPAAVRLTVQEAQDISYALREASSRAYRGGFNSRGKALQNLSTAIRGSARQSVPEYDQWLRSFADSAELDQALRNGRAVFRQATEEMANSAADLADVWPTMSQAARDEFRRGVGEAILDQARSRGGVTAMRRLMRDREIADRIKVAFGSDEAFERFMQSATREVQMQNTAGQVLGGSPTGRRVAGAADLNAQQGVDAAEVMGGLMDATNPVALSGRAMKEVLRRLPRRDRSILGDNATNEVLADALTNPDAMRRLLAQIQRREAIMPPVASRRLGLLAAGPGAGAQTRLRGLLTTNP